MRRRRFIGGLIVGFALTVAGSKLVDRAKKPEQPVRLLPVSVRMEPKAEISYIDGDAKITYLGWNDKFPHRVKTSRWPVRPNLDK